MRKVAIAVAALACAGGAGRMLTLSAPAAPLPPPPPPKPVIATMRYAMPDFGEISVYRPQGEPRGVVILLSDKDGWTANSDRMAKAFAAKGLLVAGASTPALMQAMARSKPACNNANYPFIDLARDVQHRTAVKFYMKPVLVGYGAGGTLAYASIAQWANAGYQGAVSINPAARLASRKPWCAAPGFAAIRQSGKAAGWRFGPNKGNTVPWVVVRRKTASAPDGDALSKLVAAVPHARLIDVPDAGADALIARAAATVETMAPPPIPQGGAGQVATPDMPLTIVPAQGRQSDVMAIAYSGDGGWVGIDKDLAAQVAAAGIPVVGVDSLSYFWSARNPKGAGQDLSRLIQGFAQRWNKRRVILIGYSFGADVMPYMIDNLDADARAKIESVALLGLSSTADFQFHLTSWIDVDSSDALPTLPAIVKLKGLTIRCVRGDEEDDSACPSIPAGLAQQYVVPGGHHFDRNAPLLSKIVLGQRAPGKLTQ